MYELIELLNSSDINHNVRIQAIPKLSLLRISKYSNRLMVMSITSSLVNRIKVNI